MKRQLKPEDLLGRLAAEGWHLRVLGPGLGAGDLAVLRLDEDWAPPFQCAEPRLAPGGWLEPTVWN